MQMGWFCHSMEKILLLVFKTGFLGLQWLSLFFLSRGLARPFSTSFCCFMLLHISGLGSSYLCLRVIVFFGPVFSQNKFLMPLCHISVIFPYQITLTKLLCRFFFLCWLNHLVQRQFPLAIQSYQHVSWALFAPTPFPRGIIWLVPPRTWVGCMLGQCLCPAFFFCNVQPPALTLG